MKLFNTFFAVGLLMSNTAFAHDDHVHAADAARINLEGTAPVESLREIADERRFFAAAARVGLSREEASKVLDNGSTKELCESEAAAGFCDYVGREAIDASRRVTWDIQSMGGTAEDIRDAILPIIEAGAEQTYLAAAKSIENDPDAMAQLKKEGDDHRKIYCLGFLKGDSDVRSLDLTWPNLMPKHRLTTCAIGFDTRITFLFWSFEIGIVFADTRFVRQGIATLGLMTGAEPHICTDAVALGSHKNECKANAWHKATINLKTLWNQPNQSNWARGHAHRLGETFGTYVPL